VYHFYNRVWHALAQQLQTGEVAFIYFGAAVDHGEIGRLIASGTDQAFHVALPVKPGPFDTPVVGAPAENKEGAGFMKLIFINQEIPRSAQDGDAEEEQKQERKQDAQAPILPSSETPDLHKLVFCKNKRAQGDELKRVSIFRKKIMEDKWFDCEVTYIIDETHNTKRFGFRIPSMERFDFKPGQFLTMDLPIHEKKNKRWRSYSIASWPDGTNTFELVISYVPDGLGTNYLWKNITPGSIIVMRGALGVFTLPEKIEEDICFIATGTGVAPFRSMTNWLHLHQDVPRKNVYFLFGCRLQSDLLYRAEFEQLNRDMPGFQFLSTCSREDEAYTGRRGYVHAIYQELFADKRPVKFFLCGWRNMIDDAMVKITEMGYDRKAIHREIYG